MTVKEYAQWSPSVQPDLEPAQDPSEFLASMKPVLAFQMLR